MFWEILPSVLQNWVAVVYLLDYIYFSPWSYLAWVEKASFDVMVLYQSAAILRLIESSPEQEGM